MFTIKVTNTDSSKMFGGKDNFPREFAIETHFGEDGVDDRFVEMMKLGIRQVACREGISDGR